MRKKLKLLICFAAILSLGGQALVAQTSPTAEVTNGRFGTDVDDFFSVNYWAGVEFSKWFSYLKMANASVWTGTPPNMTGANILLNDDHWEAGAALKVKDIYLGLAYTGTFNNGDHGLGTYGTNGGPVWNSTSPNNIDLDGPGSGTAVGISTLADLERKNTFGVLIGAKDAGWKVTLDEDISYVYLPYVTDGAGKEGYAQYREGTITPGLEWGSAKDMTFGKLTARPLVGVSLAVNYGGDGFVKLGDDTHTIVGYGSNSITPTVNLDSGDIPVAAGDWGSLTLGADETLSFSIAGDGKGTTPSTTPWENRIAPYAVFSYEPADYFGIGAKLRVPVSFGYHYTTASDFGFIAVGKVDQATTLSDTATYNGLLDEDVTSTLDVGIRFAFTSGGPLAVVTDKLGLSDKLAIHGGVKVHLPSYEFTDNDGNRSHEWENGTGRGNDTGVDGNLSSSSPTSPAPHRWFQKLSLGFSLNIVPNVVLDCSYDINDTVDGFDDLFKNRILSVMLSAKY
jgi:hypothetical protein